ncbi:MAG: hypothetical protein GXP55_25975, partial [Deltaproteobacteria bacterium]|nr:hypothetical protein [Deltaproteobacteria bacterium]
MTENDDEHRGAPRDAKDELREALNHFKRAASALLGEATQSGQRAARGARRAARTLEPSVRGAAAEAERTL